MKSILTSVVTASLLAVAAPAQCGPLNSTGTFVGSGDDVLFATHYPLGFAYTMANSSGVQTWTHVQVCTNGWAILTDGVNSVGVPTATHYGSVSPGATRSLYGPAGSNPRLAPYWGNLDSSGVSGIYFDATSNPGVSAKVIWRNFVDAGSTVQKSFSVEIFASGRIRFAYSAGMGYDAGGTKYVGLSNGSGGPTPSSRDFVPGPASNTVIAGIHEAFSFVGYFDLGGHVLDFVPYSVTGWSESVSCTTLPASRTTYGSSCNVRSDSLYQSLTAAEAYNALANTAITLTPSGGSYLVTNGGNLLPVGSVQSSPVIVANGDDVHQTVLFTTGTFPGSAGLDICSNGFVSLAAGNGTSFSPSITELLDDPQTSFRSWHDLDPTIPGSGQIQYEESAALTMVTFDGVYDLGGFNGFDANTIQFQFYPSGVVVIAWGALSFFGASGTGFLVGYSPGGASVDPGSIDLATALPFQIGTTNQVGLAHGATGDPLLGSTIALQTTALPATAGLGATVVGLTRHDPGIDLSGFGLTGCFLYASTEVVDLWTQAAGVGQTLFTIPNDSNLAGVELFTQAVVFVPGINPAGALTSNALQLHIGV